MQYNAKAIDRAFQGKNYTPNKKRIAKIRTELNRLHKNKEIKKPSRGFYQAKLVPKTLRILEDPPVELHGIKLEMEILKNNKNSIGGIPSHSNNLDNWLLANNFERTTNKRFTCVKYFENRRITVTVHESGFCEIYIRASRNPLVVNDFMRLLDWLNGFFEPVTPFRKRNVSLVQIGVARDFESLQMEDVKSISLRKFVNDWVQIYYKKELGKVRFEHHLTFKRPSLSLEEAVNSLKLLTFSPDVERGSDSSSNFSNDGGMYV
jgi:hypothetical protein